jgi:hypothetical protein
MVGCTFWTEMSSKHSEAPHVNAMLKPESLLQLRDEAVQCVIDARWVIVASEVLDAPVATRSL